MSRETATVFYVLRRLEGLRQDGRVSLVLQHDLRQPDHVGRQPQHADAVKLRHVPGQPIVSPGLTAGRGTDGQAGGQRDRQAECFTSEKPEKHPVVSVLHLHDRSIRWSAASRLLLSATLIDDFMMEASLNVASSISLWPAFSLDVCVCACARVRETHQRDEVGQRQRQLHVDGVLVVPDGTQLFVVSLFFEQVMDQPLLLVSAPAPWRARARTQTCVSEFFLRVKFHPRAAAAAARTSSAASGC